MKPKIYLGFFFVFFFTVALFTYYGINFPNHHFMRRPFSMPMMGFFWVFVVFIIILLFPNDEKEDPIKVLKTRLAKGEITVSEYQTLKRHLEEENDYEKY